MNIVQATKDALTSKKIKSQEQEIDRLVKLNGERLILIGHLRETLRDAQNRVGEQKDEIAELRAVIRNHFIKPAVKDDWGVCRLCGGGPWSLGESEQHNAGCPAAIQLTKGE